eukprot:5549114-Pleurochrysis_carterae.AAC.1
MPWKSRPTTNENQRFLFFFGAIVALRTAVIDARFTSIKTGLRSLTSDSKGNRVRKVNPPPPLGSRR